MTGKDKSQKRKADKKAVLLGIGFDGDDGHKRITRGPNFHLLGGSKDTHEEMQEKAIKFNEHLEDRGKTLEQIERREFKDIAQKIGMRCPDG